MPHVPKLMLVRAVPSLRQPALGKHSTLAMVGLTGACRVKEECQDVENV
jgi:hypothetical protein